MARRVVRNHPEGHVLDFILAVRPPGQLLDAGNHRAQQVAVEVALHALDHGAQALQAHAGVDAGLGERMEDAVRGAVVLHEHQVPDLQVPVALTLADAALRAAGHVLALVDEDLGAGAAGPGVAHGPEVVLFPHAHDAVPGQPGEALPEAGRFLVFVEHRGPELSRRQFIMPGEQLPGHFNGPFLEVVPEGKIPQHLEEGVVPGGEAHVLQVVVLAAGPDAFLGAGGPGIGAGLFSQKNLFELHHAGVGEQQGGVAGGHER